MRGHIHKRVHTCADGRVTTLWYAVVDIGRGSGNRRRQRWYGGYRTRRQAEFVAARLVSDLTAGRYVDRSNVRVGDWLTATWLPVMKTQVKPTTWESYRILLELHVLPWLGSTPIQKISATALNDLYARLLRNGSKRTPGPLKPSTVHHLHLLLHKALGDAVEAGLLFDNPAGRAKPPRLAPVVVSGDQCWTVTDLRRFLDYISDDRLRAAYQLSAMTGMRRGEVLGLQWRDMNLDEARLVVQHAQVVVRDKLISSTPKSGKPRVVELDAGTVKALWEHRCRQILERKAWGPGYQDSGLVFRREDGSPVHPSSYGQRFRVLIGEAGLPRIRLHDLRHTHASMALQAGVPVKVVSERLGHANPGFTLTLYAHALPGVQAEAAAAVASMVYEPDTRSGHPVAEETQAHRQP